MRLISIRHCRPGMRLAQPICTDQGTILLNTDMILTGSMIQRLEQKGIYALYIHDEATADVERNEAVSAETRQIAAKMIYRGFNEIIHAEQKWKARLSPGTLAAFRTAFEAILSDLKHNHRAMGLLSHMYIQDHYAYAHSLNVTIYATAVGLELGYNDKELLELGMGAMLHDIGKLMVPREILYKPGKLTDQEFFQVKKHAEYGFEYLRHQQGIPLLSAHCAYQHHERMDGTGYPRGLKGDNIHKYARLLAVCDVFDALTANRVYRSAMLPHKAMEIIYTGSGTQFEKKVVEAFHKTVAIYPVGLAVTLSNGATGVVVDYNRDLPGRPVVRILKNPDGSSAEPYYEIDLARESTLMIVQCDTIL
ncbi:HD-GYP domain-containing protein [Aneurinibacillus thermoaerophilus]|uniref:HD-GYP domain-containing protein n=1 Tax=Aneurinibacillus thermoaerophilus TaxID=143495 RepID=UPI002E250A8C|nr:HD-GYP domain-containing protein [Aneurinibacillus thermoaerophilus]MED0762509.1 HD-GYP domain-containing protein [Aneurinibacillus thermoaerophilus]